MFTESQIFAVVVWRAVVALFEASLLQLAHFLSQTHDCTDELLIAALSYYLESLLLRSSGIPILQSQKKSHRLHR